MQGLSWCRWALFPFFTLVFIFAGVHQAQADAQECATFDFRHELPAVRDQGSTGWCYAFTVADLLSQRLGVSISGNDVALATVGNGSAQTYAFGKKGDKFLPTLLPVGLISLLLGTDFRFAGGDPWQALRIIKEKGACPEASFNDQNLEAFADFNAVTAIKKQADRVEANQCVALHGKLVDQKEVSSALNWQVTLHQQEVQKLFPNLSEQQISKVLQKTKSRQVISALAEEACKPRIPIAKDLELERYSRYQAGSGKMLGKIREGLSRGRVVAISYSPSFMRVAQKDTKTPTHVSSVVAQRWSVQNNRCELLVRESHGAECKDAGRSLLKKKYRCESGNVWVGADELAAYTTEMQYLK